MHRIDGTNAIAVFPTASGVGGVVGYFRKAVSKATATVLTSDWANSLQEEVVGVILAAGLSLDKADNTQLLTAINSLISGAFFTAFAASVGGALSVSGTTLNTKAIICAFDSGGGGPFAGGANGAVAIACGGGSVTGLGALLGASTAGTIAGANSFGFGLSGSAGTIAGANSGVIGSTSGSEVGSFGTASLVLAANGSDLGKNAASFNSAILACLNVELDGNRAVILASAGATADGDDVDNGGANCAIIACDGESTRRTIISTATQSAILASANVNLSAGAYQAVIASGRSDAVGDVVMSSTGRNNAVIAALHADVLATAQQSAILACTHGTLSDVAEASVVIACGADPGGTEADRPDQEGRFCAFVACDGEARMTGDNCVAIGSSFGAVGVIITDNDAVVMYSGTTQQIKLDAVTGRVTCVGIRINTALGGTGGGAYAPSVNVPAAAGTNISDWIKINAGGTDYWVPAILA